MTTGDLAASSPDALSSQIRYALGQLRAKNGHHVFEDVCREFSRIRISRNILPATGPVCSGGDQGRDFETFRSFVRDRIDHSFWAVEPVGRLVFTCTLQQDRLKEKIRSDICAVMEGGQVAGIYTFCEANVPAALRHELQRWVRDAFQVDLEIIDGTGLAEGLATSETFWIAVSYLHLPASLIAPRQVWPLVKDAIDPIVLGVHPSDRERGEPTTAYVPRDVDGQLRREMRKAKYVLVVGGSASGKSRSMYEAMREVFPDHYLVAPESGSDLRHLVSTVAPRGDVVLWLDDLERYLGVNGLTPTLLANAIASGATVLATIRSEQFEIFSPLAQRHHDQEQLEFSRLGAQVLSLAEPIWIRRLWSDAELRVALSSKDSRVVEAAAHGMDYGVAEYLAAGPQLLHEWVRAWAPGANPRGAALVAAAVDCYRVGFFRPLDVALLERLHGFYLEREGGRRLRPESLVDAMEWATQLRFGASSLLVPAEDADAFTVFDYLPGKLTQGKDVSIVPDLVWDAVLTLSSANERFLVGCAAAFIHQRFDVAQRAWLPLAEGGSMDAINNLGIVSFKQGDFDAAEKWFHKAFDAGLLFAALNLAQLFLERSDYAGAERWLRRAQPAGGPIVARMLGIVFKRKGEYEKAMRWYQKAIAAGDAESAHNLGILYQDRGEWDRAEQSYEMAAAAGHIRGAFNLCALRINLGRFREAEAPCRLAADAGEAGAANNLAIVLRDRGDLNEAEKWFQKAAQAGEKGAIHNLTYLLRQRGKSAQTIVREVARFAGGESAAILELLIVHLADNASTEEISRELESFDQVGGVSFLLGVLLRENGRSVEGEAWLLKAANAGHPRAAFLIGESFRERRDLLKARMWYARAASAGHLRAADALADIESQLIE